MVMHLRINLSNDLIKAWKPVVSDILPESHPLMCWRLDRIQLGRSSANYVCVNEATLFSFLLTGMSGKNPAKIQQAFMDQLRILLQEYCFPEHARSLLQNPQMVFGKTKDRRLIGSVTDMKKGYQVQHSITDTQEMTEMRVNRTPYSFLNNGFPDNEFMMLRKHFLKDSDTGILLNLPADLISAARRSFLLWPRALHCFDMSDRNAERVEGYLVFQELRELGARLMCGPDANWMQPEDSVHLKDLLDIIASEVDRLT